MKPLPLQTLIEEYFATSFVGRATTTIRRAQSFLAALISFTGDGPLNTVWYVSWVKYCGTRWSPTTARLGLVHTDRFLRWLEVGGHIAKSPHYTVKKPVLPPASTIKEPITSDEYEALKRVTIGTPLEFAIIVGWATGMRLSDVCLLIWDSIDMEQFHISVEPLKTRRFGDRALIPFEPRSDLHVALLAKERLPRQLDWPNDPERGVFYADPQLALLYKRQQASGAQGLQQMFRGACKKAGVVGKTFHCFRVAFCSALANGNINTALACAMSGHRDPSVFKLYVRPDSAALRELMRTIRR